MKLNAIVSLWGKDCHEDDLGNVFIEGRKPTDAETKSIDAEVVRLSGIATANAYKAQRAKEYPPMTDYLDAVVKGDTAGQQAYIDACLAIKAKYPKAGK